MSDSELERCFKAFANRRRITIVKLLKKRKEATVSEIAENIKLSFRSTSKHLVVLSAADVLEHEQRSSEVFHRIRRSTSSVIRALITIL